MKYLIGTGCSFTSGQGSCTLEYHRKHGDGIYHHNTGIPDIEEEERRNSWVKLVAEKIGYEPINLGQKGRGNRAAVKELYLNNIDPNAEKLVVCQLSGMARFDWVQIGPNIRWNNFFPIFPDRNGNALWRGYAECGSSDQQQAVDCLLNIMELQNWCKLNNAKLLMFSGFDMQIDPDKLSSMIDPSKSHWVSLVDWGYFWKPLGNRTLMEVLVRESEPNLSEKELQPIIAYEYFNRYKKEGFAMGLITPCGHPSYHGHIRIADLITEEIMRRRYV